MKYGFFLFIFIFSLSAQSYYPDYNSIQDNLDDIKRKKRCLERQNREQREYIDCLERCRQQERVNRQIDSLTGFNSFSPFCFCSQPISLGCY